MCADNRLQFSVPMDGLVLTAVGTMLLGLASALESKQETTADQYRRMIAESAKKATIERGRNDECGLEELRVGISERQVEENIKWLNGIDQRCGCDVDTVVYDSQAPQVDAAAIFGGAALPPVDPGFAERTAHLNGSFMGIDHQPPASVAVEVDKHGLPWDRRIHASTKTKCADGSWKKARNVDPNLVATVEAELKAAMSAPGPIISPEVAAAQIVTPPRPPAPAPAAPPALAVTPPPPPAPALAVTPPVPPAPAAAGAMTFPEFLTKITAMCTAGQITHETVTTTCQKYGLATIPLLGSRPDLIPMIAAELGVV